MLKKMIYQASSGVEFHQDTDNDLALCADGETFGWVPHFRVETLIVNLVEAYGLPAQLRIPPEVADQVAAGLIDRIAEKAEALGERLIDDLGGLAGVMEKMAGEPGLECDCEFCEGGEPVEVPEVEQFERMEGISIPVPEGFIVSNILIGKNGNVKLQGRAA